MLRERFSIICDDIRAEEGNKISLMGVYGDNILVPFLPFNFPKFCLASQFTADQEDHTLKIVLIGPKLKNEVSAESAAGKGLTTINLRLVLANIKVIEEGEYRFEIYFDGSAKPSLTKKFTIGINPDIKIQ